MTKLPLFKEFAAFVLERHRIYLRRQAGEPKPWTKDPVLQQYRFCNVYRELDSVTQWIRTEWREPHWKDPDLWFAMTVARFINKPESLEASGYPVPWKPAQWVRTLDARRAQGIAIWSAAYMIRGNEATSMGTSKVGYTAERVLTPLWKKRQEVRNVLAQGSLETTHNFLMEQYGLGSFLAAQIIADVKFTPLLAERNVSDWQTWAAMGPGSRKGLNLVRGEQPRATWRKGEWLTTLQELRERMNGVLAKNDMPLLSAQDCQNCNCEFFKYKRGYSRSRYPGQGE